MWRKGEKRGNEGWLLGRCKIIDRGSSLIFQPLGAGKNIFNSPVLPSGPGTLAVAVVVVIVGGDLTRKTGMFLWVSVGESVGPEEWDSVSPLVSGWSLVWGIVSLISYGDGGKCGSGMIVTARADYSWRRKPQKGDSVWALILGSTSCTLGD